MLRYLKAYIFLCLISISISAAEIKTFYGIVTVEEPVLIELIESPAFQRLKHIHQYGVAYYTTHREEYTRYEHSLGVFYLLRSKGCSLKEQIAGLLHDVSHTAFSHVGDWIFKVQCQEVDYQTMTHSDFLERSKIGSILRKYGYAVEELLPTQEQFPALEQPLPRLCADRIDYNLQGAWYQGFLTYEEVLRLFDDFQFVNGNWIGGDQELLTKLVHFSIYMSQACWGSGKEYVLSMWLAEAILKAVEIGAISVDDVRFGIDQQIWDYLLILDDPLIQKNMHMILHASEYHRYVSKEDADLIVYCKFRGIDPLVEIDGKHVNLVSIDLQLAKEFYAAKEKMQNGWALKIETCSYSNVKN